MEPRPAAEGGPLRRAVTAAVRELSNVREKEEEDAEAAKDATKPAPPVGGMQEQIKAGIEGFRSTARWIIAAFGAVFVALVGSTPFTGFTDLQDGPKIQAIIGLAMGAGGALLGIWAASRVFEPEDQSLAELRSKLQEREEKTAGRITRFFRPRFAAH